METGKGNPQVEDGHIQIANETAEALARTELSGYESRYLWVLWRKTYGWHKKEDVISNSQFVEATGIRKQHIWRIEQRLIQRKIVTKNGYKLRFNKHYKDWIELPKMVTNSAKVNSDKHLPKVTKNGNREKVTNSGIGVTKNGIHKDSSITKETIQKKTSIVKSPLTFDALKSEILSCWNSFVGKYPQLPKLISIQGDRLKKLKLRYSDSIFREKWKQIFPEIEKSDFLQGKNGSWRCTFDFIVGNDRNYLKILEGNYRNKKGRAV